MDPQAFRQMGQLFGRMGQDGIPIQDMWNHPEFANQMNNMGVQMARNMQDNRPEAEIQREINAAMQQAPQMLQQLFAGAGLGGLLQPQPESIDANSWIGQRVVIQGLEGHPELNGKLGTTASFNQQKRRFLVKVDGVDGEKLLQPKNIRLAVPVEYLPLSDAFNAALESDMLSDLTIAQQRAIEANDETDLAKKVRQRFKVRRDETDKARAQLASFEGRGIPPGDDARNSFLRGLENALGVAVQAQIPAIELKGYRESVIACHSLLLEEATEAQSIATLEGAMEAAKSAIPLLGSLGTELDKAYAIAGEHRAEIKAAEMRKHEREEKNLPDIPHPEEFMCSLTHATMRDPVVAADGNSYEREAIEKHFENADISPLTGLQLKNKELFPNNALKQLIRSYEERVQERLVKVHNQETLARTASRTKHEEDKQALKEEVNKLKHVHNEEGLAREISRTKHQEDKQALEEELKKLQQADDQEELIRTVSQDVWRGALMRSFSNSSHKSFNENDPIVGSKHATSEK